MPQYIRLMRLTPQGARQLGAQQVKTMLDEVESILGSNGVRLDGFYATMGAYDFVAVIQAPDDSAVLRTSALMAATGNFVTESMPAMPVSQFLASLEPSAFAESEPAAEAAPRLVTASAHAG